MVVGSVVGPVALLRSRALAHGDEGMVPARTSVLHAIAYLVSTPPGHSEAVTDKLKDPADAEHHS